MEDVPRYVCPKDRHSLVQTPNELFCPQCHARYVMDGGIALLDIHLNPEAAAFDEQHQEGETLTPELKRDSLLQVSRFLDAISKGFSLQGMTVLDVGCGHGSLTYGLTHGPRVKDCAVYAFDHSVASLRVLKQSLDGEASSNRLYLSSQDVYAMAYVDESFDMVFGNAVLHHFLDVESVLASCYQILKPGGTAIFAEPFAHGYVLATMLMQLAVRETAISADTPGTGLLGFITNDIAFRVANADRPEALAHLTDKHLFTDEWLVKTGTRLGFRVDTIIYEAQDFYDHYMRLLLDAYGIVQPELRQKCLDFYGETRRYLGFTLPSLFAHYKFIVLRR